MAEGDVLSTHRFGVQLGGVVVPSIREVSGLTVEVEVVETAQNTDRGKPIIRKQPGGYKGGQVTIKRGMDNNETWTGWVRKAREGDVEGARENLTIEFKNPKGETVREIKLMNAWVSEWEGPGLDAGQSSGAEETATIHFEEIEI